MKTDLQPAGNRGRKNTPAGHMPRAVVALAGNPNTGKSTIFNALTGLRQHTGNWPGKTVLQARGKYVHGARLYELVDLPGTYSLLANSVDEMVARDFLLFGRPDATIVVLDATCLERNLNLALQVMEITPRVVVCVNLIDEAHRKAIIINDRALSDELGVPVVMTAARTGEGLYQLKETVRGLVEEKLSTSPRRINYGPEIERALLELEAKLKSAVPGPINHRWVALRLMDGDFTVLENIKHHLLNTNEQHSGVLA